MTYRIYFIILMSAVIFFSIRKKHAAAIFLVLLFGLALRAEIALRDPTTMPAILYDDAHYYFKIAKNIAVGKGASFDPTGPTSGFQPLFVLATVPIFKFVNDNVLALNFVMFMNIAISQIYLFFMYKIIRLFASKEMGLFAVFIWAVSYPFIWIDLNGLETNSAFCMLCIVIYYYLKHFVLAEDAPINKFVLLGSLIGIGTLIRIDLLFLAPAIVIDFAVRYSRTYNLAAIVKRVTALSLMSIIVASPWFIRNLMLEGSIMPVSGEVTRRISQFMEPKFLRNLTIQFTEGHPPMSFYLLYLKYGLDTIIDKFDRIFHAPIALAFVFASILSASATLINYLRKLFFLFVFLFFIYLSYTLYVFGHYAFFRYFTPFNILFMILIIFSASSVLISNMPKPYAKRTIYLYFIAGVIGLFLSLNYSLIMSKRVTTPSEHCFYQIARWLDNNLPAGSKIGVFSKGDIGYYTIHDTYNLDGKCSRGAFNAAKSHQIEKFITDNKIEYLCDPDVYFKSIQRNGIISSPEFFKKLKLLKRWKYIGDWTLYKIE